jgi:hypothetical protein
MENLPAATGPEDGSPTPSTRASDSDRERVATVLQAAFAEGRLTMPELDERLRAVYAARTDSELAPIVHDLRAIAPRHTGVDAATSTGDVAVLSGFRRSGQWVVGRAFRGLAVLGSGEIDLRKARFTDGETTIRAVAVVSTITVVVPEDAEVHISGVGIVGGFDHHDEGPGTPAAPRITVTGVAVCGSVEVKRRPAAYEWRGGAAERKLERTHRRLERKQRRLAR